MKQICKVFPNSQTLEISASLHWVLAIEDLPNCDPKRRGERRAKKKKKTWRRIGDTTAGRRSLVPQEWPQLTPSCPHRHTAAQCNHNQNQPKLLLSSSSFRFYYFGHHSKNFRQVSWMEVVRSPQHQNQTWPLSIEALWKQKREEAKPIKP